MSACKCGGVDLIRSVHMLVRALVHEDSPEDRHIGGSKAFKNLVE